VFTTDGTHCAGTVGGAHFGVAKRALLHGIKVLDKDGQGSDSRIISGLDFATKHALAHGRPSVFSLSLGGSASPALDRAVQNAIKAGMTVVVAAGNDTKDAAQFSPSRVEQAIVVGAADINDRVADFSNFGQLVDVFAPGVQITSASLSGDSRVLSGTSMAW
jgi:subtilisin family serine protease